MTTLQIIGLIVVALLGLYVFYSIYDLNKFNKKKGKRHSKNKAMTLALLFIAMTIGKGAWAQVSSYSVSTSTNNNVTTFTVTRSGNLNQSETVLWRLVSVSALEGIHYTSPNYAGTFNFAANEYEKSITVTEKTSANITERYRYQSGNSRYYRFEVLDQGGFELASKTRTIGYSDSYKFNKSKLNKSVTNMVYFNNSAYTTPMSSSRYMDVYFTPPSGWVESSGTLQGYVLIDDGYDYAQKPATVSTASLINTTNATGSYLSAVGIKLYTTLCFTEKEKDDGYAYVQIIAGDANADYDGKDPDGKVNTPSNSVYKACFELYNSGSTVYSGNGKQFYPHRYDYKNRLAGNQTADHTEFYLYDGYLWEQEFKSSSYRAANSGSIVLSPAVTYLTARFDANGSGDDTFGYKDLFFRMALCDTEAPYVMPNSTIVSGSRHCKGNYIYVTLPFNEIVEVTGTPTLSSNWGTLSYYAGTGTNVITFRGTISASASGTFAVDGFSGTIKDLVGNEFAGYVTKTFSGTVLTNEYNYHVTYDLAGGSLSQSNPTTYNWSTATITLNNPTKTYYDFAGWTGSNGSTPQTTVKINTHSHGDRSYTANWTLTNYAITYDLAGGALPEGPGNPATYTVQTPAFTLVNPTRAGYIFDGWTGTGINEPTQTVTIAQGSSGNRSYTAHWIVSPWSGTGTQGDPFMIINEGQLDLLATRVNSGSGDEYAASGYEGKYFKLGTNITYNTTGLSNDDENFAGISGYHNEELTVFKGTFDGDNKTISGIRIHNGGSGSTNGSLGLFGKLDHATVKNIILNDARVTAYTEVGGIAGYAFESTIENCIVINSTINGNDEYSVCGVIAGQDVECNLIANYYLNCNANNRPISIGAHGSDCNGARLVCTLTLGQDINVVGESVVINNATYYASNTTVTLSYEKSIDNGYQINYFYNDGQLHNVTGNTFTMPDVNTTVSSTITPIVYTITYNLNDGNLPEEQTNPTTYTIETPTFTLINPVKTDNTFDGWTGSNGDTPQTSVEIYQGSTGNREYTANWHLSIYDCIVINFPWAEDFESYEANHDLENTCWVNEHIAGTSEDLFYVATEDDNKVLKLPDMDKDNQTILVLPLMRLTNDNYEFSIDVKRINYGTGGYYYSPDEGIRIFVSTNNQIEGATELAFIPHQCDVGNEIIPAEDAAGWYTYELPIGSSGDRYIIIRGESQFMAETYIDNFVVQESSSCHKPLISVSNVTSHGATVNLTSNAEAWQICLNNDEEHLININTKQYNLENLEDGMHYTVKVRTNCGNDDFSAWSNIVGFHTPIACPAPFNLYVDAVSGHTAQLTWDGSSDSYIANYRRADYQVGVYEEFDEDYTPNGWNEYHALVDDVLAGNSTLGNTNSGSWACSDKVFDTYNMKINIYGTSVNGWLVTHEFTLDQSTLSFDIALTIYNTELPIDDTCAQEDDRFIVLIYADDEWQILREWNNSGSQYVYNEIPYDGENVSIDVSAYNGKKVRIAFYGESTVSNNGDNDLHIDNVHCGTLVPAGEWIPTPTDDNTLNITGLLPLTDYEAMVRSNCPGETAHESEIYRFTTDVACMKPEIDINTIAPDWVELSMISDADSWEVEVINQESLTVIHQNVYTNPCIVTDLFPDGFYSVCVRANCGDNVYSEWSNEAFFTTLETCPVPFDVTVSDVTCNSATVTWNAYNDSYILTWSQGEIQTLYTYDFEDNTIPDNMENVSDYPWEVVYNLDNGSYYMKSTNEGIAGSTSDITIYTTYPVEGYIEFDAECRGEGPTWDRCSFFIDGNRVFNEGDLSSSGWLHYAFHVTEGAHCFTWMYIKDNSVDPSGDYFAVDNIVMQTEVLIPQDPVNTTNTTYTFNDLQPEYRYHVQVAGVCDDEQTADSEMMNFTTPAVGISVNGYDDANSEGGWAFIATPVLAGSDPSEVANLIASPVQNYDLYRLNPSTSMWENYKNTEEHPDFTTMVNGQGYLYANKNNVSLDFTGTINDDDIMEIDLHQGWNLVGNPFAVPAYIDREYYKMNDEGSDIIAVENYQETAIPTCTAVLVRATASNQKVVFTRGFETSTGNRGSLQLTLSQTVNTRGGATTRTTDNAIVSFKEGSRLAKYIFVEGNARIYFTQDNEDYAVIAADPYGEMPVNFKTRENGSYSIAVIPENVELNYLHLIDNLTGANIDLLATPEYTFTARPTDYASRFRLVFSPLSNSSHDEFAFISNGEIVVNGTGTLQVIDLLGHILRTEDADRRISTAGFLPGVYVLRLINGNEVKNQRIIIK